jgi:hypothetical protein
MDPPGRFQRVERETLELGATRGQGWTWRRNWRGRSAVVLSVAVGVAAGAVAVLALDDHDHPPERERPAAAARSPVRLVLSGVSSGARRGRYLAIDAVLLHDGGAGAATVRRIHRPGTSLSIRVPDLPVTLSANHPYERVRVHLAPRSCVLATEWTPSARPLTLSWEDEHGTRRSGLGGDHDSLIELSLIGHMSAVCDHPSDE